MNKLLGTIIACLLVAVFVASSDPIFAAWQNPTAEPPGDNVLLPTQWSAGANSAVYRSTGNVGIGTSTPAQTLTLKSASGNTELSIQSVGTTGHWGMYHDAGTSQFRIWNGDNRVVISTDGNVGIGTLTPEKALEVAGDIKGTRLCIGDDCRDEWPTGDGGGTSGAPALRAESGGPTKASTCGGTYVGGFCNTQYHVDVTFAKPFTEIPKVIVSPAIMSDQGGTIEMQTDQIFAYADQITETGFRMYASGSCDDTCGSYNYGWYTIGSGAWLAVGEDSTLGGTGDGGSSGWEDIALDNSDFFDINCHHRAQGKDPSTGEVSPAYMYAVTVQPNYLIFDVSSEAFVYYVIQNDDKGYFDRRKDGGVDTVLNDQEWGINKIQKNCGGDGTSGTTTFTCPSGFTKIESQGFTLGCIQTDTASASTACRDAIDACHDTYGGRLPSYSEFVLAKKNYSLTVGAGVSYESIDDVIIEGPNHGCAAINASDYSISYTNLTETYAHVGYRCFIPASGGGSSSSGSSLWTESDSDVYRESGNVGIGTTTPTEKLEVSGKVKATELCIGSDCKSSWPVGGGGGSSDVTSAFYVYKTAVQYVPWQSWTTVTWNAELFDKNQEFTNNRFTPKEAGTYVLEASIGHGGGAIQYLYFFDIEITKNGSVIAYERYPQNYAGAAGIVGTSVVAEANGTTDFFEVKVYQAINQSSQMPISPTSAYTHFSGTKISGPSIDVWENVDLTDTGSYDSTCQYRMKKTESNLYYYSQIVESSYAAFNVDSTSWIWGVIQSNDKQNLDYAERGNPAAVTQDNIAAIAKLEKFCPGTGAAEASQSVEPEIIQQSFCSVPTATEIPNSQGADFCALTYVDDDSPAAGCIVNYNAGKWYYRTGSDCGGNGCAVTCVKGLGGGGTSSLWTESAGNVFRVTGKVGVGTNAPNGQIHIKTADAMGNAEMSIQTGDNNHWAIYHDETTEQLRFWNDDISGEKNALIIDNAGRVGIGTTILIDKVTISTDSTTSGLYIQTPDQGPWALRIRNTSAPNRGLEMFQSNTGSSTIYNNYSDGGNITFGSTNVLSTTSNIGIGTTTPTEKLEISGGNIKLGDNASVIFNYGNVALRNSHAFDYGPGLAVDIPDPGAFEIVKQGVGPVFVVKSEGSVGVGTVDPKEKLFVSGGEISQSYDLYDDIWGKWIKIGGQDLWGTTDQLGSGYYGTMVAWDSDYAFFGLHDVGVDRKELIIGMEQSDNIRFRVGSGNAMSIEGNDLKVTGAVFPNNRRLHVPIAADSGMINNDYSNTRKVDTVVLFDSGGYREAACPPGWYMAGVGITAGHSTIGGLEYLLCRKLYD